MGGGGGGGGWRIPLSPFINLVTLRCLHPYLIYALSYTVHFIMHLEEFKISSIIKLFQKKKKKKMPGHVTTM